MFNNEITKQQEKAIKNKMEELRKYSHKDVSEIKLRQGAMIALGLKPKAYGYET